MRALHDRLVELIRNHRQIKLQKNKRRKTRTIIILRPFHPALNIQGQDDVK
jgi:hypothetical protein